MVNTFFDSLMSDSEDIKPFAHPTLNLSLKVTHWAFHYFLSYKYICITIMDDYVKSGQIK